MEKTLVLVKPDSVQRGLIGEIIARYEKKGFKISAMKFIKLTDALAAELYKPHYGKPFYAPLVEYMTSGPIVALAIEGVEVVKQVRAINGATNPQNADPGSIRGDFGQRVDRNCVHASEVPEDAQRELKIFFDEKDYPNYELDIMKWL